jgi:SRSO17 transposase
MDMLSARRAEVPHGWIAGDAEFGRCGKFREQLRTWEERYVLDVPCNILVRDLERKRPRRRKAGHGRKREVPFVRAEAWAAAQAPSRWERFKVSDGEKGPIEVDATRVRVRTRADGRVGPLEWLLVTRTVDEKRELSYALSNAGEEVSLRELVRVKAQRHQIEELFEAAKGEVGLDEYEVRGWNGWHHHITLSFLALWFLTMERRRLGKKNPGHHGSADPSTLLAAAS